MPSNAFTIAGTLASRPDAISRHAGHQFASNSITGFCPIASAFFTSARTSSISGLFRRRRTIVKPGVGVRVGEGVGVKVRVGRGVRVGEG